MTAHLAPHGAATRPQPCRNFGQQLFVHPIKSMLWIDITIFSVSRGKALSLTGAIGRAVLNLAIGAGDGLATRRTRHPRGGQKYRHPPRSKLGIGGCRYLCPPQDTPPSARPAHSLKRHFPGEPRVSWGADFCHFIVPIRLAYTVSY